MITDFELNIILVIIIVIAITCVLSFYVGIWRIHVSINNQTRLIDVQNDILYEHNNLIREQNTLKKEYIELIKQKSSSNS